MREALAFAAALAAAVQFATSVNLVEVYAVVTDDRGRPVTNLTRDDFEIMEDGRPQQITAFTAGNLPLAVALAVDRSFSMAGKRLAVAKSSGHLFLGELAAQDLCLLLAIGSEVEMLSPLSADRAAQHRALNTLAAWGTTPLYDAMAAALDEIESATGRRALVVLSDGDDRASRMSADDILERVRRSAVLVYAIAFGGKPPPVFDELGRASGGKAVHVTDADQLSPVLRAIAQELRHQYLIGYVPRSDTTRTWRTIEVKVRKPGARVRARAGYVAP